MIKINTKYGVIEDINIDKYFNSLVNKVFKLLPLKEENSDTLPKYINSLLVELCGANRLIQEFSSDSRYLTLISTIEGLNCINDFNTYRSEVFKCIDLIKKMHSDLREGC